MIDVHLSDGTVNQFRAEVTQSNALKVATEPYYIYDTAVGFFSNPDYGIEMNREFGSGAVNSDEVIHDGVDTVAWTASAVTGTFDFSATSNPDSGTKHIEHAVLVIGDTFQLIRSSSLTSIAAASIEIRLSLDSGTLHPNTTIDMQAYSDATTGVGVSVNLLDYINTSLRDTYQTATVPVTDMLLTGVTWDRLNITVGGNTSTIGADYDNNYYRDPTGGTGLGTQVYTAKPDPGEELQVHGFNIVMADAYTGTLADGTMPKIRYDGFLGLDALTNGMLFQTINNDETTTFAALITQFSEMLHFGRPSIQSGSDGTNTWLHVYVSLMAPIILRDREKDRMTWTFSDDLSGLELFRVSFNGYEKKVSRRELKIVSQTMAE